MRKRLKLTRIAEEIVGYHPKEVTSNFSYFVKRCLGFNSNYNSIGLKLFTLCLGIVYYWIPSCRLNPEIIYIPKVYLMSENVATGFLVHEILHLKHPEALESNIHSKGKELMAQWRENNGY
jgi:hypothetical protein